MSIVNTLKNLKTNLFGGPGNTGFTKPPPSKVQGIGMTGTPISSLDSDPLQFGTYQFPKDVFENQQLGHYMVFYVNVQDRSKYSYDDQKFVPQHDYDEPTGLQSKSARLRIKRNKTTGSYSSKSSGEELLSESNRNSGTLQGLGSVRKTTTRIKDSIALYLPANVADTTSATYEDSPTGMLGVAAADIIRFGGATELKILNQWVI
jgi:hypothetical protein